MYSVSKPKILIVSLHYNEPDIPAQIASIAQQVDVQLSHRIISDRPNLEAHQICYQVVNDEGSAFDAVIKLDGDMVFSSPRSALRMFEALEPGVDMTTFPVKDKFTNSNIYGVHIFSPRVRWNIDNIAEPRVDPLPAMPGRRVIIRQRAWAPVLHAYFAGSTEYISFGFHRASKCFGSINNQKLIGKIIPVNVFQFLILTKIARNYVKTKEPNLKHLLFAAEMVRLGNSSVEESSYKELAASAHLLSLRNERWLAERVVLVVYWGIVSQVLSVAFLTRFHLGRVWRNLVAEG